MTASKQSSGAILCTDEGMVSTKVDRQELPNLDILRSMAVLFVLVAHSMPLIAMGSPDLKAAVDSRLGRFGVLIFFVHTAYVLTLSMERLRRQRFWPTRFYLQRIFRIYPLSLACVTAAILFHIPAAFGESFVWPSARVLLANIMLGQNLFASPSIIGSMWSLPYEVQMYAVMPPLLWWTQKYAAAGAGVLFAGSCFLATAELSLYGPGVLQFAPCFLGGFFAFATRYRRPVFAPAAWPIWLLILAAMSCFSTMPWLQQWGICLILGVAIPFFRQLSPDRMLSRVAAGIARYSYGIYLAHMPLRWLCFERLPLPAVSRWGLYLLLIAVVSIAAHHLIEAPAIRVGKRFRIQRL